MKELDLTPLIKVSKTGVWKGWNLPDDVFEAKAFAKVDALLQNPDNLFILPPQVKEIKLDKDKMWGYGGTSKITNLKINHDLDKIDIYGNVIKNLFIEGDVEKCYFNGFSGNGKIYIGKNCHKLGNLLSNSQMLDNFVFDNPASVVQPKGQATYFLTKGGIYAVKKNNIDVKELRIMDVKGELVITPDIIKGANLSEIIVNVKDKSEPTVVVFKGLKHYPLWQIRMCAPNSKNVTYKFEDCEFNHTSLEFWSNKFMDYGKGRSEPISFTNCSGPTTLIGCTSSIGFEFHKDKPKEVVFKSDKYGHLKWDIYDMPLKKRTDIGLTSNLEK